MAKITITLPNDTLISLEWDGSMPVHEVLGQVLRDLRSDTLSGGRAGIAYPFDLAVAEEKSTDASTGKDVQPTTVGHRRSDSVRPGQATNGVSHSSNGAPHYGVSSAQPGTFGEAGDDSFDLNRYSDQAKEDFKAFCQAINPTGDMRRVVVAAEAANRFFGLEGITADEVGDLFDLIGWRRANQFTQTIRNAARAKFGWLERIPGRSGRYAATDFGRSTTLSG